jgi:predicted regulator of Ras-like GTPase activity (Roadblock/LC7/MglB family)
MLEPSLDLYGETYEQVDSVLADLLVKCHARYALIVDRKGFVLVHQRAVWAPKPPSLDSLATLIASNHSANVAIARLFGEAAFRETVQQGEEVGTYVEELGPEALLVTVFDGTAVLGKIKLFTKQAVERLRALLDEERSPPPALDLDETWSDDTVRLFDGLFTKRTQP